MRYFTGKDIEPLIKRSAKIAKGDGHAQFSLLVGAVVILARVQGIDRKIIHRAIDASFDHDPQKKPTAELHLYDRG